MEQVVLETEWQSLLFTVRGEVGLSYQSSLIQTYQKQRSACLWGLPGELGAGAVRLAVHPGPGAARLISPTLTEPYFERPVIAC